MEKKKVSKKDNTKETKKKEEKVEKVVKEEKEKKEEVKKEIKKEPKKEEKKGLTKESKDKIFKGIGVAIVVALIVGFAYWTSLSYGEKIDTSSFEFTYIDVDQYLEYMKDSEARIIYVAKPDCSYCQMETPIVKRLAVKNDLTIYYLDTTDFLEHDEDGNVKYDDDGNAIKTETGNKFVASAEKYKDGWGTPNTIIVKDGKIVDGVYQYVDEASLTTLLKNNGFIK